MSLSSFVRCQLGKCRLRKNRRRRSLHPFTLTQIPWDEHDRAAFPRTSQAEVLIAIRCDFFLFVVSIRTLLRDNDIFDVAWLPIFGCWLLVCLVVT